MTRSPEIPSDLNYSRMPYISSRCPRPPNLSVRSSWMSTAGNDYHAEAFISTMSGATINSVSRENEIVISFSFQKL